MPKFQKPIYVGRLTPLIKAISDNYEQLFKANYKTLKPMLPEDHHDHVVKWTADNIKHPPLQTWYLRNYKQDNSIHTPENQAKIQHYDGMTKVDDSFKNVDLGKHVDFKTGLDSLEQADKKFQNSKTHLIRNPKGEKMIDFGNGMAWWNLKTPACSEEGKAMGHCGNAGGSHENDTILSLRREHKVGNHTYYEPMATFIHNQNYLGEMKGRGNYKPKAETHPYIADLLSHPDIHGATGGQYAQDGDFHFDDLSPELQAKVRKANPKFTDIRSDAFSDEEKSRAVKNVPDVEKMQDAVKRYLNRKALLEGLNNGSLHPSDLSNKDIALIHDHPAVTSKQVNNAFAALRPQGAMYLSRSPKLDVEQAIQANPHNAVLLGRRLKDHHVDQLLAEDPETTLEYLKDRLKDHHLDHIASEEPSMAAYYLKDRLKDHHVDHIVNILPSAAAAYLGDRLKDHHIDQIVANDPSAAAYQLQDRLTPAHRQKLKEQGLLKSALEYSTVHKIEKIHTIEQELKKLK